ncbi:hypothetical protein AGMMS49975_28330 [Clostridia bacterium]|nr:hypothetical protein AGMMS49975_28330 [Clostridia bacterium]
MGISDRMFCEMYKQKIQQKRFANDLNINYETVKKWRVNSSNPPAELIAIIADYLGVSVYWLLTGEKSKDPNEDKTLIC